VTPSVTAAGDTGVSDATAERQQL